MSKNNNVFPLVRKVMDEIGDNDIVATVKSPIPKMVTHDNEIVGVYNNGVIDWFDTPKAEEAKKYLEDE
jgi:hypothetical protein